MTVTITHSVPGRMRVRVRGQRAEKGEALSALRDQVGDVGDVTTDARTGSALITYDPTACDPAAIVELLRQAHSAFRSLTPPRMQGGVDRSASTVAREVQTRAGKANAAVLQATQGRLDLRILFPLTLGGLALRQLVRQGVDFRDAPWYVLAYYAFDSYIKLHGESSAAAGS